MNIEEIKELETNGFYMLKDEYFSLTKDEFLKLSKGNIKDMFNHVNEVCFVEPYAYKLFFDKFFKPFVSFILILIMGYMVINYFNYTIDSKYIFWFQGFITGLLLIVLVFGLISTLKPLANMKEYYLRDFTIKEDYIFLDKEKYENLDINAKKFYTKFDNVKLSDLSEIVQGNVVRLMKNRDNVLM